MTRLPALLAIALGCGPTPPPVDGPETSEPPHIVCVERGPQGGRLVIVGEDGDRIDELTTIEPGVQVRDASPVFSPDGAWILFVSSRGRKELGEGSLWIVAAQVGATPRRLTSGDRNDMDPVFSRDGKQIVYASIARGGTSTDLWRVGIDVDAPGGPALRGSPEQLTDTPEMELHPSAGPGGAIAYTLASDAGSSIWILDGAERRQLTHGKGDITPSWAPDGAQIAFASARSVDLGEPIGIVVHTDLFVVPAAGGEPRLVVDEPRADQLAPRWSRDGRWLFATTALRALTSEGVLLYSVVHVDLRERTPVLRSLVYPGGEDQRSGPALGTRVLDSTALHGNPGYAQAACESLKLQLQQKMAEKACRDAQAKDPNFECKDFSEADLEPEARKKWSEVCKTTGR
jgi:dipeptidyl aminopeptidase/acylaminoacyl peptidase